MFASQIVKKTQPSTEMETDNSNQPPYPVQEYRKKQRAHFDRCKTMMLDSAALEATDRAWIAIREKSVINQGNNPDTLCNQIQMHYNCR